MDTPTEGTLVRLSETDRTIADVRADVRGRRVVDRDGEDVGKVDDLLIDAGEEKVRFLRVAHGGFLGIGAEHFLIPVDAVTSVTEDTVHIDRGRSRLGDVPGYDPELAQDPTYLVGVYGWWGYPAFWGPGYSYPGYPY